MSQASPRSSILLRWLVVTVILCLAACGGGTSGTGGDGTTRILGRLVDQDGRPLPSISVRIGETGDFGLTDSNGNFDFASVLPDAIVTFEVDTSSNTAAASLEIPAQPLQIDVALKLNQSARTLAIESSQVQPRPTPTPEPTASAENGDQVLVTLNVYYPGNSLSRARLKVRGKDNATTRLSHVSGTSLWYSYLYVPKRGGRIDLKLDETLFTVSVGKSGPNLEGLQIITALAPLPSTGVAAPNAIILDRAYPTPDRARVPEISVSPEYTGPPIPLPTPSIGTPAPTTPTPYGGIQLSNYRINIEIGATAGTLDGGTARIVGSSLPAITLHPSYVYDGYQSYFVNLGVPAAEPAQFSIDLPTGQHFTLSLTNIPYQASYSNLRLEVLPRVSPGSPLPQNAGVITHQSLTVPGRFRNPTLQVYPPPPPGSEPTPTPAPTPPTQVIFNLNYTSPSLALNDATISVRGESGSYSLGATPYNGWYAAISLPPASSNRTFDLQTSAGVFTLYFENIPASASLLSAQMQISSPSSSGARYIELISRTCYPEEGDLSATVSPLAP